MGSRLIIFPSISGGGGGTSYWTASGSDIYNNNAGNVYIGKSSGSFKFEVNNTLLVDDTLNEIWFSTNGTTTNMFNFDISTNNLQLRRNTTPIVNFHSGYTQFYYPVRTTQYYTSGNSGVNTQIRQYGASDSVVIQNSAGTSLWAFGPDGDLYNPNNTTSVFLGSSAGILDDGTSNNNTGIGYLCLDAVTSGGDNTATGVSALSTVSTGDRSIAYGSYALQNINSNDNVGIGYSAFTPLTSGSNNVGLGNYAGNSVGGGLVTPVTSSNNGIFIGYNSGPSAATGSTNEIVIGHQGLGNGSNTVTIGNSSTASNHLTGDLYVGSTLIVDNAANKVWISKDGTTTNMFGFDASNLGICNWEYDSTIIVQATSTYFRAFKRILSSEYITGSGSVDLIFRPYTASHVVKIQNTGGTSDLFVVNNDGNIGIGVAPSSTYKLDVNGIVRATSYGSTITSSGAGSYSVALTDYIVFVTGITASGDTYTLPSSAFTGQEFIIKDVAGGAGTDNLTIATAGSENIDGASTQTIAVNYGWIHVKFDGTNYFILNAKLT